MSRERPRSHTTTTPSTSSTPFASGGFAHRVFRGSAHRGQPLRRIQNHRHLQIASDPRGFFTTGPLAPSLDVKPAMGESRRARTVARPAVDVERQPAAARRR
ncbi:MAG: hypothetical protein ACK56I_12535, partial [bacterium]